MPAEMLETPVLFLIYNRAETTRQVFERIRQAQPQHLYIAADGPRTDADTEKCRETRRIVEQVDWPCTVKTLFREKNLGCGQAVSSAISWFFEQVEAGIILEDDTLPDPSFFGFCTQALARYRDDDRVLSIGGTNFLMGQYDNEQGAYFSALAPIWGWATWRRTWQHYTLHPGTERLPALETRIRKRYPDPAIADWVYGLIRLVFEGQIDTWDVQLLALSIERNTYTLLPTRNLVSNIGYVGTHHNSPGHKPAAETGLFDLPTRAIDPAVLQFPADVVQDIVKDSAAYAILKARYLHTASASWRSRIKAAARKLLALFRR